MGPTIILDKSTLQGLTGNDEAVFLRRYYILNLPPVLLQEIGADLRKEKVRTSPEEEVQSLSRKLSQMGSIVCPDHTVMVQVELLGEEKVPMNGQVPVQGDFVSDNEGNKLFLARPSDAEADVLRWQIQRYTSEDYAAAAAWRASDQDNSLEAIRNENKDLAPQLQQFRTPAELLHYVDCMLSTPDTAEIVFDLFRKLSCLDQEFARVRMRWDRAGRPPLAQFAPYSYFCVRAVMFHHLGLLRGFFTTRSKDLYDLIYVFYLPFCYVFSSSDNFLKTIVPPLLRKDQIFVSGSDLKADLRKAVENRKQLKDTEQPPRDSLAQRIRDQLGWGKHDLKELSETEAIPVARKRRLPLDGPCICCSGKTLRECCYPKWFRK